MARAREIPEDVRRAGGNFERDSIQDGKVLPPLPDQRQQWTALLHTLKKRKVTK